MARVAGLLRIILLAIFLAGILVTPFAAAISWATTGPIIITIGIVVTIVPLSLLALMHRGHIRPASILLSLTLLGIITFASYNLGGIRSPSTAGYGLIIVLVGLLLGGRATLSVVILSIFATYMLFYAEGQGLLPMTPTVPGKVTDWVGYSAIFIIMGLLLHLAASSLSNALERAQRNERAMEEYARRLAMLNAMNTQFSKANSTEEIAQVAIQQSKALVAADRVDITLFLEEEAPVSAEAELSEPGQIRIPLMAGERAFGKLTITRTGAASYTSQDLELMQQGASLLAATLENRRLFEQLEMHLREVEQTAERLREVDRLKSIFVANMSHELRTPLNAIIGYAEVLLMGLDGELNQECTEDVQAIRNSGKRLLHLINDILDLAKIESGRMALVQEEVSIPRLVEEVCGEAAGLLYDKPLSLQVEVEDALPKLRADGLRLGQVLTNLLSNAIKFTEEGTISLRAYRKNGHITLEVADSGIGMNQSELEKIFDEFHQVDNSSTRRGQGTGLGLAITRHLVHMHGGTINVQSEPGKGSTFRVALPILEEIPHS